MAVARARGRLKGRAPKLSAIRQAHMRKLHKACEHNIEELAELFDVSRPTVYRSLDRPARPGECGRRRFGHSARSGTPVRGSSASGQ